MLIIWRLHDISYLRVTFYDPTGNLWNQWYNLTGEDKGISQHLLSLHWFQNTLNADIDDLVQDCSISIAIAL